MKGGATRQSFEWQETMKKRKIAAVMATILTVMSVLNYGGEPSVKASSSITGPYTDTSTGETAFNYVYFGNYPQTEMTGSSLTTEIKNATYDANGNAWVGNKKYAKQTKYYAASNDDTVGYYRYEPIRWRIIQNDGTNLTLQAANALDCVPYDISGNTDYGSSDLKEYLNNDFFNKAFTSEEQAGILLNNYQEKISILTADDATGPVYGQNTAAARIMTGTDYSRAKGNYVYDLYGGTQVEYWTSTNADTEMVNYIDCNGELKSRKATYNRNALVPIIKLSISELYYSSDKRMLDLPSYSDNTQTTTWDTVTFGSYPQTELTGYISNEIASAVYNEEGIAVINGSKYKRTGVQGKYHYYKFEPISWKVLAENNGELLLQSAKVLDAYDGTDYSGSFETSGLCSWLNTKFINDAFDETLQVYMCQLGSVKVDVCNDNDLDNKTYGYYEDGTRKLLATDYAVENKASDSTSKCTYWIKSTQSDSYISGYVNTSGTCIYSVFSGNKGVVPVIRIKKVPFVWNMNGTFSSGNGGDTSNPSPSNIPDSPMTPTARPTSTPDVTSPTKAPTITITIKPTSTPSASSGNNVYFTKSKPASVKVTNSNATSQKITWKKISGATGYYVYRATSKNGSYKTLGTVKGTSYKSTKLKKGTTYYYVIQAYQKKGNKIMISSKSSKVSKKAGYPTKPGIGVKVKKSGNTNRVIITWSKVTDGQYIQLYRSINGKKYTKLLDTKITKKNKKGVIVKYKYASGTYRFKIRTYNKVKGKKLYSSYSTIKKVKLK